MQLPDNNVMLTLASFPEFQNKSLTTDCILIPDEIGYLGIRRVTHPLPFSLQDGFIWLEEKGWWKGFKVSGATLWGWGREGWRWWCKSEGGGGLAAGYQETAWDPAGGLCSQEPEAEGWGYTAGWARQVRDAVKSWQVSVLAVYTSCQWQL